VHGVAILFASQALLNSLKEILLAWLTKHEAIQSEPLVELIVSTGILTVSVEEKMPANPRRLAVFRIEHPVRVKAVLVPLHAGLGANGGEDALPQVPVSGDDVRYALRRPLLSNRPTDRQTVSAVDAPFSLLEIDWVRWKIPMNDVPTEQMEVEAFLTD
jgi:hypothetical protein